MEELITIAEFDNANSAYVLKTRLEAEGLRVFLLNENVNQVLGLGGFFSVKVQVPLSDSFKAMDILYEE